MEEAKRIELLNKAKQFFREEIVSAHIDNALIRASRLSDYNVHPFLLKYLANFLEGNDNPRSIAKALLYPRILGTSITTIFGSKVQKMVSQLFEGMGSAIPGIDIEFVDALDGRKKYCQLKSGPNTINKDDVVTISGHFQGIKNKAKLDNLAIGINDLIVGILYGDDLGLSAHYRKVAENYPVFIGKNFWHRLTGDLNFYTHLIDAIGEVAIEVDGRERLEAAISALAQEIEASTDL